MDDSYPIPNFSDVMGKGCITTLFKNRAVIACGYGDNHTVEIMSKDTFKDPSIDLKDKFDMAEEVVYKANKRAPAIAGRPRFVATYVRRVKLCFVGEASISFLEKSHGFLLMQPEGQETMQRRIFFPSLAYGDFSAKSSFSQIRNCQAFFRIGDRVSYVAIEEKGRGENRNRCDLYCLHFDLILNENYNSRLNNVDQPLIGIIVQILEPINAQNHLAYRHCRIYVKKVGYLTLYAQMVHRDLTDLADIVQPGDRLSFKYRAAESDSLKKIKDVNLMDKNPQLRLKKWMMDNCHLNNSSPTHTYKFNDFDSETASYNGRSSYTPSRSTSSFHSQYGFGSGRFADLDASHDSVMVHAGSQNTIADQLESTLSFGNRKNSLKMAGNCLSQPSTVRKLVLPMQQPTKTYNGGGGGGYIPRELVKAIGPRNHSVSTQTDSSGDDSLLEKIMEDDDIFNFIASKKPQIIREYCKSKKRV